MRNGSNETSGPNLKFDQKAFAKSATARGAVSTRGDPNLTLGKRRQIFRAGWQRWILPDGKLARA